MLIFSIFKSYTTSFKTYLNTNFKLKKYDGETIIIRFFLGTKSAKWWK